MENNKSEMLYANLLYEKLLVEKDESEIAKELDGFFLATSKLEKYSKKYIGDLDYDTVNCYEPFVVGMIQTLKQTSFVTGKLTKEFYNSLWVNIKNSDILSTEESKIFALWLIAKRKDLPYCEFNFTPVKMDDEEFERLVKKNEKIIGRLEYIQNLRFSQRTEIASLILNEILSLDDFADRVLVFSIITQIMFKKEELQSRMRDVCMIDDSQFAHTSL